MIDLLLTRYLTPNGRVPTRADFSFEDRQVTISPATGVHVGFESRPRPQMMENERRGTMLGRLTYRTPEEARAVAEELGLSDIHSHMQSNERVYMPGRDHDSLNKALRSMGRPPTEMPGSKSGMSTMGMGGRSSTPNTAIGMDDPADGLPDPMVELPEMKPMDVGPMINMNELTDDRGDDDMEVY